MEGAEDLIYTTSKQDWRVCTDSNKKEKREKRKKKREKRKEKKRRRRSRRR